MKNHIKITFARYRVDASDEQVRGCDASGLLIGSFPLHDRRDIAAHADNYNKQVVPEM